MRPLLVCAMFTLGLACGSSVPVPDGAEPREQPPADPDGAAGAPAPDRAPPPDDLSPDGPAPADTGPGLEAGTNPGFEVAMTYTTANIGRNYGTVADVRQVFAKVEGVIGAKAGPKFIGWQEIGEGDPCGASCEIDALLSRFAPASGWETVRPMGQRPAGGSERVKVPITSQGANQKISTRATFASPGWAGVSPTRFVTVSFHADRNVSIVNTHFIAGAWSCASNVAQRRAYWNQAWQVLKSEVAQEQSRGRNVVVTGDLNRPRAQDGCNPAWDPTSLHPRAKTIGGAGIDYVFAVPAAGYKFEISQRSDGTKKTGSIVLGIDGHKAHWVTGVFLST